ncbi:MULTISPECIES: 3-hydroxyacyl-CoA dehydrogenase [Alloalcanivorax]|jgi:3-hydroxyacyl-CoA dehydrogenase / 3-hydroxy-2-methylbutyryl-CoA dehydrogenase|uniref:3-hydroxyacyl-CoA dehydrogenase n=2 Tax=Alloalcanivorax TaxID=3020832 RepID=A0A9Q3ZFS6_9GAMM|nr:MULTISPECIES: 3-hydroxyacyl-CoA dehydrogenase [Alloalcanivorax]ERS13364.1 3-hydroxy-2-methylbutyryl-CoA dehydrogenase [Alcanivorax sp. PN-3]KYZ87461.1 3-hydroxy-2-methylbutyryl-CoA dehydrogenase [Alcanivorax sp. KX64203]MBA4722962.1 3-hydroxyacyl-CoA dehydrogenase [Alcanivorax sp.]ARB46674.1 3-hydroxy-2-methylbutyryl-CoA dehydrogenase [Alloalcanivorax xenomutans]MCE7510031.1 3-hydroxyacyl-CoA dehydrogenase [Alloalcanivorax xenomutans]|tara:strand:- start:529 stop:1299 length:771 start_codon:yes stop_codon:yes gene_type:complete
MDIKNKVAVVTGGASGLGRATVEALAARGAKVMILDRDAQRGEEAAAAIGASVAFTQTDVTDEASVQAAIDATRDAFGAIHLCVNCAGVGSAMKTVGRDNKPHDLGVFNTVVQINLIGTFNVTRLAAAVMAENEPGEDNERGLIVNTASVAAFDGQVGQVAYSATKGAVVGMTLPIARDLASLGIRCNTIAPGIFNTPLMNAAPDKVKMPLIEMTQFPKRLGHPEEYAAMVCHMAENRFLNGETIRLDGGIRMQPR